MYRVDYQLKGFSLVYWKDSNRQVLEIEAPCRVSTDSHTINFWCFDSVEALNNDNDRTKRYLIPLNSISYIETNFG